METIYFAGGCLWGVQEFMQYLPGVIETEAGRANGATDTTQSEYDGYAECVKVVFDSDTLDVDRLMDYFFEIIDPYSVNRQGPDEGLKYRTGVYSFEDKHLTVAKQYIERREDASRIAVEVLPLSNYVRSDEEHQQRLTRFPDDICHLPKNLLHKYKC